MTDATVVRVFGGSASMMLTAGICRHLGVQPGDRDVIPFSEGNIFVRVKESVRGKDVYLVQSTSFPVNDNFMELLFWVDALKRASAATVTVVMPYFSYAKGDKQDEPRVSIRARVCADAIEAAGADRLVTLDLHAPQIQGFFKIPVDDLNAFPVLCDAVRKHVNSNLVVVAPDTGFAKKARNYANYLKASLAIATKKRDAHDENAEITEVIGDVQGKMAVLVDDFTISANTLVDAAAKLKDRGAVDVMALVTHGVFAVGARERIDNSNITRLLITDTVESQREPLSAKVEVVSVAPLFGEAIRRIHDHQSISVLFPKTR